MLWKPRGILDESVVNEIVVFIETAEARAGKPFNRFTDLSALDAVCFPTGGKPEAQKVSYTK